MSTSSFSAEPEPGSEALAGEEIGLPEGRFSALRRLGESPFGATYRAYDRKLGRDVVVRSLASLSATALYRLREPVAKLRRLFHENLAPIFDVSLTGNSPFLVRDHVSGELFAEAFRRSLEAGEHRRAAEWLVQVLEGLDALARHGFSHGHLTSSNLRLVDGRAIVLDGGLRDAGESPSAHGLAGPDKPRDLEALIELLQGILQGAGPEAATPWEFLPDLETEPERLRTALQDLLAIFSPAPSASPILLDRPFVGRENELAKIHQAALKTRRGRSVTLLVSGTPGIGRSALLAKAKRLIEVRHDDALVLAAGCRQATRPGGALDALLLDLIERLARLTPREVEVVLPARPRELATVAPIFLRLESVARAAPGAENVSRERAVASMRQLFDRIAERRPLVMILDDADRADPASLEILSEILAPPDPPPMMLLLGVDARSPRPPALEKLISPMNPKTLSIAVDRLELGPLDERESRWMTRTLIGAEAPKELIEGIASSSRGLPSWIVRLVNDVLDREPEEAATSEDRQRREAAIGRIQGKLSAAARCLLHCLALIDRPVHLDVARAFANLDDSESPADATTPSFETVVDQLLSDDLIRFSHHGETLSITDPLIRETLLESSDFQTQELHSGIARCLAESGAEPGELARHWQAAGQWDRAASAARSGAIAANQAGEHDEATSLWRLALDLEPADSKERLPLLRSLAEAFDRAGDFVSSAEIYFQASKLSPGAEGSSLRRLAADRRLVNGDQAGGLEWLAPLLERSGLRPLIVEGGGFSTTLRRLTRRLRHAWASLEISRRDRDDDLLAVDIAWTLCRGLRIIDPGRSGELSKEHLLRAQLSRDQFRICRALALETAYQAYGGWRRRARVEKLGRRAITLARQLDEPRARALAEVMSGEAWLLLGEWRKSLSALDRGQMILEAECPGAWWERRVALFQQLRCLAMLGKLYEVRHLLAASRSSEAVERADFLQHAVESRFSWLAELAEDRPGDALKILERRRMAPDYSAHPSYWQLYGEIEIAIYRGDVHFAWHHLDEYWSSVALPRLGHIEFLRIEAWHQRGRAALAALAMRPEGAEAPALRRAAEQARDVLEKVASPWSEACALLVRAGLESLSAQRYAAAETLQRAETRLDHLDMALAVQACRRQRTLALPSAVADERLADADRRMRELGAAHPQRMADLFVPGSWIAPAS